MPVVQGDELNAALEQALDARRRERGAAVEPVWDEAKRLIRPAYAYTVLDVVAAEPAALIVAGGHRLASPVVSRLFATADAVVLLVFTIGTALEERVAAYANAGGRSQAALLDVVGTLAVNELGRLAHDHIRRLAAERGLRSSIPLNPGTSHWPIEGQATILALLPAAAIGLSVTKSGWLRPAKSISMAIALGRVVLSEDEASSCDYCDHPELCRGIEGVPRH